MRMLMRVGMLVGMGMDRSIGMLVLVGVGMRVDVGVQVFVLDLGRHDMFLLWLEKGRSHHCGCVSNSMSSGEKGPANV